MKDIQSLDQIETALSARRDSLSQCGDDIKSLCQQLNKGWIELAKERRRLQELQRNKTRLLNAMGDSTRARAQSDRREPHYDLNNQKYDDEQMGIRKPRNQSDDGGDFRSFGGNGIDTVVGVA